MDESLPQPMVTAAGIVASTNYGIQIRLEKEQLALRKRRINWGFMQTAQACSCAEPDLINKVDILSIEIFSNNDFDASHPKNTDLSLYFEAKNYKTMIPIAGYIKRIKDSNYFARTAFLKGFFWKLSQQIVRGINSGLELYYQMAEF